MAASKNHNFKKESETLLKRYQRLVDVSPDGIAVHDGKKVLFGNPAAAQILGFKNPKQFIGQPISNFVHPDFAASVGKRIKKMAKTGKPAPLVEEKFLDINKNPVDVEVTSVPIVFEGKDAFQVIFRDLRGRKKAETVAKETEEQFKSLAENSPNMIFINQSGHIVYANKKCEEIMGYSRKELYSAKFSMLRLIAPESQEELKKNFQKHSHGEEVEPCEYNLITKDSKKIIGFHNTKLIKYKNKPAILGIITDITDMRKSQQKLQTHTKELEEMNKLMVGREIKMTELKKEINRLKKSAST